MKNFFLSCPLGVPFTSYEYTVFTRQRSRAKRPPATILRAYVYDLGPAKHVFTQASQ